MWGHGSLTLFMMDQVHAGSGLGFGTGGSLGGGGDLRGMHMVMGGNDMALRCESGGEAAKVAVGADGTLMWHDTVDTEDKGLKCFRCGIGMSPSWTVAH